MLERILAQLDLFHLDNLLRDKQLHVLHLKQPADALDDVPAAYQNIKIVFVRGQTIGLILDGIYYVKPNFFKGGQHYNVYIENETKLILETYGLREAKAIDLVGPIAENMMLLQALKHKSDVEKDLTVLEQMTVEADALAAKVTGVHAFTVAQQVRDNYVKACAAAKPSEAELKAELLDLVEKIKACDEEDVQEISDYCKQAQRITGQIPDGDQEVRAAYIFISEIVMKLSHAPGKKPEPALPKTAQEKEYQDAMKKAERFYTEKSFKKSKALFELAGKIFPTRNAPKEFLERIAIEEKRV